MVLLIGGSSHVGKTLLSQKLLERLHYPYISLDHLKMAFIRTGMTDLTVEDDNEMREFLFPFAAELIKTAIENRQNLIVEGCYIPADWKSHFSNEYLKDIRCVFLVMSEQYLMDQFETVKAFSNAIEHRIEDDLNQKRLIACSLGFKQDCMENRVPFYEIDQEFDIDAITDEILKICGISKAG